MGKKSRSKKRVKANQGPPTRGGPARYTPAEIAMAVLGAAILVMLAGIVITSFLE